MDKKQHVEVTNAQNKTEKRLEIKYRKKRQQYRDCTGYGKKTQYAQLNIKLIECILSKSSERFKADQKRNIGKSKK